MLKSYNFNSINQAIAD